MSTLRELRESLEQHAEGLHDTERYARVAAVRNRVQVVRRRRASLAAVAAAVVLVTGIVAAGALRGPGDVQPAGPSVVGVDVPAEVTTGGFAYSFAEAHDLSEDQGPVRLPAGAENRAVSLVATGLGSGSATLVIDGTPVARAFEGDPVEVAVPAFASTLETRVSVRLDGTPVDARAGIAVYDATGDLPAGVTDGTRVFRDQVAGSHLVAADFSEPGDALELPFEATGSALEHADFCSTSAPGVWMTLLLDGKDLYSTQCKESDAVDVGGARTELPALTGRHTLSIRLTQGHDGPPVAPDDAVLGLAVYQPPLRLEPGRVAGFDPPSYVEWDGRTWEYVGSNSLRRPDDVLRAPWSTDGGDVLVGFAANGDTIVSARWRGDLTRGQSVGMGLSGLPAWMLAGVLLEGDDYEVTLSGVRGDLFTGGLVFYEPVDPPAAW